MGRGSAYSYEHFMLYDDEEFMAYPYKVDNEGNEIEELDYSSGEWDDLAYDEFKEVSAKYFNADILHEKQWVNNESYYFAENNRFYLGIDASGGFPCIFVQPKEYSLWNNPYTYKEYKINKEVVKGFNRLIKQYEGLFRYPSSAWTSYVLQQYCEVLRGM